MTIEMKICKIKKISLIKANKKPNPFNLVIIYKIVNKIRFKKI